LYYYSSKKKKRGKNPGIHRTLLVTSGQGLFRSGPLPVRPSSGSTTSTNASLPVALYYSFMKKNREHNGQRKKYKRTNNDLQNIHIKLKIEEDESH